MSHGAARLPSWAAALAVAGLAWACLPARATTFGPSMVIQCPGSDEVRRVLRLYSGNTWGAVFWSDGFSMAPGLPDLPRITRCVDGGPIFWVESAAVLGSAPSAPPGGDQRWDHAPFVRALSADECLEALAQGLGDTVERERYLRLRAWWAANAPHRRTPPGGAGTSVSDFPAGSPARANLEALAALLDDAKPNERWMKAEVLRQLARFDEARALLEPAPPQEPGMLARWTLLKERLAARDARVARLPAFR